MRWTERQLTMLREMGIRVWLRDPLTGDAAVDAAVVERPMPEQHRPEQRIAEPPAGAERSSMSMPPAAPRTAPQAAPASTSAPALAVAEAATAYVPAPVAVLAPADWLVVGEPLAAGVDPALLAQLLDNLLRAVRVARDGATRELRAAWLEAGTGASVDLDAAIAAVSPRVVLALGKAAAQALLGLDEPLGKLRERGHARGGVPVVVSFDLAYLLRHPAEKAKAWADLCRAAALLD